VPGDLLYTKHIVYPDYIAYLTYTPEQRGSQVPFSCPTPPVIQPLIPVVVDHDDTREMLCMSGEAGGFRVVEGCDGLEA
jgi:hypothetical protein